MLKEKKKLSTKNYSQQNYLSKIKEKLRHSQLTKKLRKFASSRSALQEVLKGELQDKMKGY